VASQARARAPGCRLLFVSYLTILPPGPGGAGGLTLDEAAWGRDAAARLAETTRRVAETSGSELVDAAGASLDHHAWSASPWTGQFKLAYGTGAPYHPNAYGMRAVADMVLAHVRDL
jgi:hypothetical protein